MSDGLEFVKRDGRWADLERLRSGNPMYDATIEEVKGRRIRVGDHWLADFASCNYLGFDLEPEIMEAIEPEVRRWGTHPSWSRLLGNPALYPQIEEKLTALLDAPDTLVLPTITHIHMSVLPILAGKGHIFLDSQAHKTIYDGSMYARGLGATVTRFHANSVDHLRSLLKAAPAGVSKIVAMDGVNSMTGNAPDLAAFAAVCREYGALLYVDDAHGFGVIGERGANEKSPYGLKGNAIVKYAGETYDNIVLVGGFSKSYSSLLAFLALPTWLKNHLKVSAPPYLYSGPAPTASLATVLAGLSVNEKRGDDIRASLYRKTMKVLDHVRALGVYTPNTGNTPVIELPLAEGEDIDVVGKLLWDRGIYVTLAAYPLVPRDQVGFRAQVTAANGDDELDELNAVITELNAAGRLRRA
ncbi:aminotransferase class I/II-fold pyridoxal phosphate-dependent enzyme [Paractinoplanes atraurantiacus]|uniref:8-amino-7-oxononanoate synthase n=1 Tax=Paractinoplanes atraurantiacus TaxID=1036182 RepID=A0A285GJH7_9ACTN|nr:pyridoxal phosphate-dependent aminotransferase family protein [Actinoplanes atraurantiacus]SNY23719.1 8-amino-7-oxononanoate synthase [Actinoplanes atraurantiacus]